MTWMSRYSSWAVDWKYEECNTKNGYTILGHIGITCGPKSQARRTHTYSSFPLAVHYKHQLVYPVLMTLVRRESLLLPWINQKETHILAWRSKRPQ